MSITPDGGDTGGIAPDNTDVTDDGGLTSQELYELLAMAAEDEEQEQDTTGGPAMEPGGGAEAGWPQTAEQAFRRLLGQ